MLHITPADIIIATLAITNGITLGLYLAKRKKYSDLVLQHKMEEDVRWNAEEITRIWNHIHLMEERGGGKVSKKISL